MRYFDTVLRVGKGITLYKQPVRFIRHKHRASDYKLKSDMPYHNNDGLCFPFFYQFFSEAVSNFTCFMFSRSNSIS